VFVVVTFRVCRRRRKMYIGHSRLCVCLTVCASPHSHTTVLSRPGCNLWEWQGWPLVVHYWADLQSVHGFRCYDNIAPNAKCQRVLVFALSLVLLGDVLGAGTLL